MRTCDVCKVSPGLGRTGHRGRVYFCFNGAGRTWTCSLPKTTTKPTYAMKGIGEKIRKIRNIRGYSQEYMGTRLKMSQNNYSRIELDQINLTLKTLSEIASVLEVSTEEIMNFSETRLFHAAPRESNAVQNAYAPAPLMSMLQEEIIFLREDRKKLLSMLENRRPEI